MTNPDPMFERLAKFRVNVPEPVRQRQLDEILVAVRTAPPVRAPKNFGLRRRWATAIASLAIVVAPVGTAVAAEDALPGEVLYPVKQVSERVRGVFDEDLAATHRVEELETLVGRDTDASLITEAERRAGDAVAALDNPGDLAPRLEQARLQIRQRNRDGTGPGNDGDRSGGPNNADQGSETPGPNDGSPDGGGEGPGPDGDPQRDQDQNQDGTGTPGTGGPGSGTDPGGSGDGTPGSGGSGTGGSGAGGSGSDGSGSDGSGSGGQGTGASSGSTATGDSDGAGSGEGGSGKGS